MRRSRIFFVPLVLVVTFLSGCYGARIYQLYELARLEGSLSEVPGFYDVESEECSFTEHQKRAIVIVAIPDELLDADDKRNDAFARTLFLRGNEWREVDLKTLPVKVSNKWLSHTVRVYQPPLTPPGSKKVASATE